MVFPSLQLPIESGMLGQFSFLAVMAFSYFLRFWKKLIIISTIVLLGLGIFNKAYGFAAVSWQGPGQGCGTMCVNNMNYYGRPMGNPYYYYPGLQYHSFYGPMPYYFRPHGPSPYRPMWMNTCPTCQMNNPMWMGPQFNNNPVHHGPMS